VSTGKRSRTSPDTAAAVDAFMAQLEHPHKPAIALLRTIVTGADPRIAEGIKWNAPSWRTHEYFATTSLREKNGIGLILHRGAKVRDLPAGGLAIPDSDGRLKWLAPNRAMLVFGDAADLRAAATALAAIVRAWVAHV
jgi:hypothetical protein